MRSSALHGWFIPMLPFLLMGCSTNGGAALWDGQTRTYGALRAMFHAGQTGPTVALDSLLPDPDLFALGALAGLSGEVTVLGGKACLSYPAGEGARTETTDRTDVAATLLVVARVPAWRSVTTKDRIRFEELDDAIAALGASAGMTPGGRFPFLVQGELQELEWHVIDGTRLTAGGTSHEDHLAAAVRARRDRAPATLIGFYSEHDQGVFTHMGSRTHVHCVVETPIAAGHVDHVVIPAGTLVKFPERTKHGN